MLSGSNEVENATDLNPRPELAAQKGGFWGEPGRQDSREGCNAGVLWSWAKRGRLQLLDLARSSSKMVGRREDTHARITRVTENRICKKKGPTDIKGGLEVQQCLLLLYGCRVTWPPSPTLTRPGSATCCLPEGRQMLT